MSDSKSLYKSHSFLCHFCGSLMLLDDVDDSSFNEVTVFFYCPHCNTSLICTFWHDRFLSGHYHFEDPDHPSIVKDYFIF